MRILHLITRLIVGGAQENTVLTCRAQAHAESCTVCLASGPTYGPEGSLVETLQDSCVELEIVPALCRAISPWRDAQAYRQIATLIRTWKPDVVHTHSSKAGVLGRIAAWRARVPLVVHTIHGLPFHPYQNPLLNRLYRLSEWIAARHCHHIYCVADAMGTQAAAAGVAASEKFSTVYSGMELEPFFACPTTRDEARARWKLPIDALVIGKVARLFELKGHDDLLEVAAQLRKPFPNLHLLLIGDGLWRERLERRAQRLGIADRVHFAGLLPPGEIPRALRAMDVLAHCSLREGLARVLPQALLAGVPVVSYDVDGAREVIRPGETGWLVPPQDRAALARALREALADLPAAQRLAETGRAWCRERFDWHRMAEILLEDYRARLAISS